MLANAILYWFLTFVTVSAAISVIMMANPIYSALSLAMTMVGVAALFVCLNAYFIACVQIIVYAGAVVVLFVMVMMLFDLKHELQAFTRGVVTGFVKIAAVGMLSGLVVGAIIVSNYPLLSTGLDGSEHQTAFSQVMEADSTKALGRLLFTKYVFGFETLGVLLMVVAIGAVALSRARGGTHAKR